MYESHLELMSPISQLSSPQHATIFNNFYQYTPQMFKHVNEAANVLATWHRIMTLHLEDFVYRNGHSIGKMMITDNKQSVFCRSATRLTKSAQVIMRCGTGD